MRDIQNLEGMVLVTGFELFPDFNPETAGKDGDTLAIGMFPI
jgi:hypothetical protein